PAKRAADRRDAARDEVVRGYARECQIPDDLERRSAATGEGTNRPARFCCNRRANSQLAVRIGAPAVGLSTGCDSARVSVRWTDCRVRATADNSVWGEDN